MMRPMMTFLTVPRLVGLSLILDIILIDQFVKWWIMEDVLTPTGRDPLGLWAWVLSAPAPMTAEPVTVTSFFNLVMVWNHGISFGMFQSGTPWPLIVMALVISSGFVVWMMRSSAWTQIVPLALVVGGALGNVIDRFRFGAVADFFDLHVMGWHYPAFNIADSAITIGIALLLIDGVFWEPKRQKVTHV